MFVLAHGPAALPHRLQCRALLLLFHSPNSLMTAASSGVNGEIAARKLTRGRQRPSTSAKMRTKNRTCDWRKEEEAN